ncbi:hypothetical protein WICPIJ_006792 [Wickerhamomyces pijperi]|uniref:Mannan endo-1,6-alpha-mannosidase n=1 Tax=Wickerhamomyces pijperi TaxID=599730 RepID=A0A9P8TKM1_WICPI|nr:hypothetical protein WICPIJ_006792 [Wickerhamomyces pijperi]
MTIIAAISLTLISLLSHSVQAIDLDITSKESICSASSLVVDGLMDYYEGTQFGGTIGMFQRPYYWWQAGHALGGVLDHWYYCQNDTYELILLDSLIAQAGENYDYVPSNQSLTEGNDDQGFWGILVMGAVERNFTSAQSRSTTDEKMPDWLGLTQAVYNTMWSRWDNDHCGGGLRWQIFSWNSGYSYKNTISSACLFHIAARLARFTSNETYLETAETVYQWLADVGYVVEFDDEGHTRVFDGADIDHNCTTINHLEWTYNIGIMLSGCAYLYNFTESDIWLERTTKMFEYAQNFFKDGKYMYERACSSSKSCNTDQRSFRAIFSRSLGLTSVLVPTLTSRISILLQSSAIGASESCVAGYDGHTCGQDWSIGSHDGVYGLGEQMAALEIFNSLLVASSDPPLTKNSSGNTLEGDVNSGLKPGRSDAVYDALNRHPLVIKPKDKAGAAIITALILSVLIVGTIWMCI